MNDEPLRICVLRSSYEHSASAVATLDPPPDPTRWLTRHAVRVYDLRRDSAVDAVRALAREGFDVFVNLCDGMWFEDIAGIEVAQTLEALGVAYTGPTPALVALTKEQMKHRALALGVRTPAYVLARDAGDVERAVETLPLPVLVKHFDAYGSLDMGRDARVTDADALRAQAQRMISRAGGALLEAFIEGDEYTVLAVENPDDPAAPHVFEPVQCAFPPGETFKHFELKWQCFEGLAWRPCEDPALRARLCDATRAMFLGVEAVSYARCDFRVDAAGRPHFLEINTSCGVFYPPGQEGSADEILRRAPGGHEAFLSQIVRAARARARRRAR